MKELRIKVKQGVGKGGETNNALSRRHWLLYRNGGWPAKQYCETDMECDWIIS